MPTFDKTYTGAVKFNNVNWSLPIDISIPLRNTKDNVTAWYVDIPRFEPVADGNWIGDVNQGGSVNFRNIFFNPHGHGTHTECVGHISRENFTINQCLKKFFFTAQLITVTPDHNVITLESILSHINSDRVPEALIVRTLPNTTEKLSRQYSHTHPPCFEPAALQWMADNGIDHLLTDLPSVDPENDEGKLLAHKAFWKYPAGPVRTQATITEMIFVPDSVMDGHYVLNLMIASFENDASPSKPVLYSMG